jgi:hypothetical protein
MNCQHYHICISENGSLCEDSKCIINKKQRLKENEERLQKIRRLLDKRFTEKNITMENKL